MMEHLSTLTGIAHPTRKLITASWSMHSPMNTSINVRTADVYNIVDGYSVEIEENSTLKGSRYIVNMKISNDLVIRYLNLDELYIPSRYAVPKGFKIGKANKEVGIEYCTRVISKYPIRISDSTFYKHDPTPFLIDDYLPEITLSTFALVLARNFEVFDEDGIV